MTSLPGLAAENHVCPGCGVVFGSLGDLAARREIGRVGYRTRALCESSPDVRWRPTSGPRTWSALEYACHLRDISVMTTIRLHRARHEDDPTVEPMVNDLRSLRFQYNDSQTHAVLDELDRTARGTLDEIARIADDGWERTITGQADGHRTVRWLVRNAAHEAVHHLRDITAVGESYSAAH